MSKRQLVEFLNELKRAELKEQVIDLYQRFKDVKEFYDFSFNPKEGRAFDLAKQKIGKEYFPDTNRRAKKRRSVAQKQIVHLQKLEADPVRIADLMLFNLDIAQTYLEEDSIKQEAFYKSMLNSFRNALVFISKQHLKSEFEDRINRIIKRTKEQTWYNHEGFIQALDLLQD